MTILNVTNAVNTWVEEKLGLDTIFDDVFPHSEGDEIICRHDPAPASEQRYTDGTRLVKWSLSYYVRNANSDKSRELCDSITKLLDGAEITDEKTGVIISVEAQTLPQWVAKDDKNNTIYSASIYVTYLDPREE